MARGLSALLLSTLAACETGVDAEAVALPALTQLTVRATPRCPHCGRIESKRVMPPDPAHPRAAVVYKYMVRMTDGSSSVFEQALPATWRVGERLMVN